MYPSDHTSEYYCPLAGDFNNDNRLDVVYYSSAYNGIFVALGLGDGNFQEERKFTPLGNLAVVEMTHGNFNEDNYLDLVTMGDFERYIAVLIGIGDGTFRLQTIFYSEFVIHPMAVAASDLNGDNRSDIIVLSSSDDHVAVLLGNGDGTFRDHMALFGGCCNSLYSIAIGDFNNDNYVDIAVINRFLRNLVVYLGHNNGSFEAMIASSTGGALDPESIVIGDFNSDNFLDVAVSYQVRTDIGILLGYGNGSFGKSLKLLEKTFKIVSYPMVVVDFNGDRHLDIVFYRYYPSGVDILLGDGKGHFQRQSIYRVPNDDYNAELLTGDFNGDGYQDVISAVTNPSSFNVLLNKCGCCAGE